MGSYAEGMLDFVESHEEELAEKYVAWLTKKGLVYDAIFWFEGASASLGEKYREEKERYYAWLEGEYEDYSSDRADRAYDAVKERGLDA